MRLLFKYILPFLLSTVALAQTDSVYYGNGDTAPKYDKKRPKRDWLEDLSYGGNLQLLFGSYTFIYLAPNVGFKPTEDLTVGLGPVYSYWSVRSGSNVYSQSLAGGHTFARYRVFENISLVGQYDRLYQPDWNSNRPDKKIWVDYLMAGGAFVQPAGDNMVFYLSLMYNLTPHRSSIYPSNFVIQSGFSIGF